MIPYQRYDRSSRIVILLPRDASAPSWVKHFLSHMAACRQSSLCTDELLTLGIEMSLVNEWTRISVVYCVSLFTRRSNEDLPLMLLEISVRSLNPSISVRASLGEDGGKTSQTYVTCQCDVLQHFAMLTLIMLSLAPVTRAKLSSFCEDCSEDDAPVIIEDKTMPSCPFQDPVRTKEDDQR